MSAFFFNDTATTEIYTLSLHDALPICGHDAVGCLQHVEVVLGHHLVVVEDVPATAGHVVDVLLRVVAHARSEEHTSELQSRQYLVCRLLLEKKKKINENHKCQQSSKSI